MVAVKCARGDLNYVQAAMEEFGQRAVVNARARVSVSSQTCLHIATENGELEMMTFLLKGGAPIEAKDRFGYTPLFYTAVDVPHRHQVESIKLLLDAGADVDAKDPDQWTPLFRAALNGQLRSSKAYIDAGADVNVRDKRKWTPLHVAVGWNQTQLVKLLLDAGADVNAKDIFQETPFQRAARWDDPDLLRLLVRRGAEIDAGALENAIYFSAQESIKELIKLGASFDHIDSFKNRFGTNENVFRASIENGKVQREKMKGMM